jgi:thymidylate kinase
MALITKDNIKKLDKERNSVHSKVRATYTTFTSEEKNTFKLIPTEVPQEK